MTLAGFIIDVILVVWLVGPDVAGCEVLIAMNEPKVMATTRRLGGNSIVRNGLRIYSFRRVKMKNSKVGQEFITPRNKIGHLFPSNCFPCGSKYGDSDANLLFGRRMNRPLSPPVLHRHFERLVAAEQTERRRGEFVVWGTVTLSSRSIPQRLCEFQDARVY